MWCCSFACAVQRPSRDFLDYAFDKNLPDALRTTVVACIVQDSQAYWAHAGDRVCICAVVA